MNFTRKNALDVAFGITLHDGVSMLRGEKYDGCLRHQAAANLLSIFKGTHQVKVAMRTNAIQYAFRNHDDFERYMAIGEYIRPEPRWFWKKVEELNIVLQLLKDKRRVNAVRCRKVAMVVNRLRTAIKRARENQALTKPSRFA